MRLRSLPTLMLVLLVTLAASPIALAGTMSRDVTGVQWSAVLPEFEATLQEQIDGDLSRYVIDADFVRATDTDLASISGALEIDWVNPANEPAEEVLFRLYANAPRYREGSIQVADVEIDGVPVEPAFDLDDTLMSLPLTTAIEPGGHATITMSWQSVIPDDTISGFGMFNHDTRTDSYTLDHWLPLLAGYDPENGFDQAPITINGDPVFSNVAFFEVTMRGLDDLVLASTGVVEQDEVAAGGRTMTIVSGPVRNFTMAISANYEVATGTAGGTEIRSYYLPGHEIRGEASVEWAIDAIELFNDLIGPYPYQQFSIVDAVIGGGAAGIEFPQIVYIASDYYDDPLDDEYLPHGQEYTLVHEVIHQWFYALVGNNQDRYAFLDESLTNYLSVVYFEKVYDEDVALQQALLNIIAPYVIYLWGMPSGPSVDEPVNTATDAFSSGTAYGVIIYNKGPLAFQAIREAIGDEAFFDAIASYFRDQQLLIAQPDDLENAFAAEAPSDLDFEALWQHWIEEANGADDFPPELLDNVLTALRGG